jgi:acyl dehydratase
MGKFKVGDKATLVKSFTEKEVRIFAEISGDDNPVHLDPEYAKETPFGQQIVHGILVASIFSGLVGAKLPGYGSIYLGQTLNFKAPVFLDEELEASVEVIAVREDKPIITLKTLCVKKDGTVAVEGEAVMMTP